MKLKSVHADVWISVVMIAVSIVFYGIAGNFPNPDAAVWPRAVLVCLILLSTMLLLRGIRLTREHADTNIPALQTLAGPMGAFVLMIAYVAVMNFFGYFVSTAIFIPLSMYILGQRSWKVMIGVTAALELFIYVLFVLQLRLRMP